MKNPPHIIHYDRHKDEITCKKSLKDLKHSYELSDEYIIRLFIKKGIDKAAITPEDISTKRAELQLLRCIYPDTNIIGFRKKAIKVEEDQIITVGMSYEESEVNKNRLIKLDYEKQALIREKQEHINRINASIRDIDREKAERLNNHETKTKKIKTKLYYYPNYDSNEMIIITDQGKEIGRYQLSGEEKQITLNI